MSKYHVTYFYLATGMEGIPDKNDYGIVEANSPDEAKDIVVKRQNHQADHHYTAQEVDAWFRSCLSAKLIDEPKPIPQSNWGAGEEDFPLVPTETKMLNGEFVKRDESNPFRRPDNNTII
jgi:hypothetical protein